jgi:beta-lactam-binding protein with PASTA domain
MTPGQAIGTLDAAGLHLGTRTVECRLNVNGRVLAQNPDDGSRVPAGTGVNYTIGGPPPQGHQCP